MTSKRVNLIIVFLATFFLSFGSAGNSKELDVINHFSCSVSGYTPLSFELYRNNMAGDFEFRMTDTTRKFQWDLSNGVCEPDGNSHFPGTFSCNSSVPGKLALELIITQKSQIYNYDRFVLDVKYRRDPHFSYPQRVIAIEFSGGDFDTPYRIQKVVNVSFYEGNERVVTVFRESCSLNGSVIKE